MKTYAICVFGFALFLFGCHQDGDGPHEDHTSFTFYNPAPRQMTPNSHSPPEVVNHCYITRNATSIIRVKALSDIEVHPSQCGPIPYSMSHYSLSVEIEEHISGAPQALGEAELIFVNVPFMVYPIERGDRLLVNVRVSRKVLFAQTHVLLLDDSSVSQDLDRTSQYGYILALPEYGDLSEQTSHLFVDENYQRLCGGERVTVSDETFERLKFEPREECSEGAEEPPETPDEPNPASDEPGM